MTGAWAQLCWNPLAKVGLHDGGETNVVIGPFATTET